MFAPTPPVHSCTALTTNSGPLSHALFVLAGKGGTGRWINSLNFGGGEQRMNHRRCRRHMIIDRGAERYRER